MTAVKRRNRPGTKAEDWCDWATLSFNDMESTLAVQEYIEQLIRTKRNDVNALVTRPEGVDELQWIYEHLRLFCIELNQLVLHLESVCTNETCSQMKATDEWLFFCAVHSPPLECNAIDYTVHTIDGAVALLNSKKVFPARNQFSKSARKHFESITRRLYRIFAHTYFHHRDIFDEFEVDRMLYHRFVKLILVFNLLSRDQLIIPQSAINF